jgi:hypothetical protein
MATKSKTQNQVINVNRMELVRQLMQLTSATPATFVAITEVKLNKSNPYFGRIQKKQRSNVFINFDYENSVNKALLKEGKVADFKAKPRAWGNRIPNTPLILHKNTYYLEARFLKNEPIVEYFLDNEPVDKADIQDYLPKDKIEESKPHGLEEAIIIRDFKIDSIHEITVNGTRFVRTDI